MGERDKDGSGHVPREEGGRGAVGQVEGGKCRGSLHGTQEGGGDAGPFIWCLSCAECACGTKTTLFFVRKCSVAPPPPDGDFPAQHVKSAPRVSRPSHTIPSRTLHPPPSKDLARYPSTITSGVEKGSIAQWKRGGPIPRTSEDQKALLAIFFSPLLLGSSAPSRGSDENSQCFLGDFCPGCEGLHAQNVDLWFPD